MADSISIAKDFYTLGTMATLSGATGGTFVVCNGIQQAFNYNPRWLALLVAQIIVLAVVYLTDSGGGGGYFIGVINGFMVYCSAAGATGALGAAANTPGGGKGNSPAPRAGGLESLGNAKPPPPSRQFLSSWF